MPLARTAGERLHQQRAHAVASSIQPHKRTRQAGQKRRASRQDSESFLKLHFRFVHFVDAQERESVAEPCPRISRQNVHGIFVKREGVLPDVVVRDAQETGDRHGAGRGDAPESRVRNRSP